MSIDTLDRSVDADSLRFRIWTYLIYHEAGKVAKAIAHCSLPDEYRVALDSLTSRVSDADMEDLTEDMHPFYRFGEKEECDTEQALSYLLREGVMFCNNRTSKADEPPTICLYVNCSDLFAWGYADAEYITTDEVGDLYKHVKANRKWGSDIWCCKHRNEKPQPPVLAEMKVDGVWTSELEALPDNQTDEQLKAMLYKHVYK